jgi:hypothetical protein
MKYNLDKGLVFTYITEEGREGLPVYVVLINKQGDLLYNNIALLYKECHGNYFSFKFLTKNIYNVVFSKIDNTNWFINKRNIQKLYYLNGGNGYGK